jgi:hypothetical protein
LVSTVFHPSDIGFAVNWGGVAPGWGGWKVMVDKEEDPEVVAIAPPGLEDPIFFLHRDVNEVVLAHEPPGADRAEVARFANLREALLNLCPVSDEALEEIHLALERDFPRER